MAETRDPYLRKLSLRITALIEEADHVGGGSQGYKQKLITLAASLEALGKDINKEANKYTRSEDPGPWAYGYKPYKPGKK